MLDKSIFHAPEGTKCISLKAMDIDFPMVMYFRNEEEQQKAEDALLFTPHPTRAVCFAASLAFQGIQSQIFPASYRISLIKTFKKAMEDGTF